MTKNENAIASMNIMGFMPSVFEYCKIYFEEFIRENSHNLKAEFYLPYIVNTVVKTNTARVKVLNTNEKWFGVTYKEDKALAKSKIRELVAKGIYPENLWGR